MVHTKVIQIIARRTESEQMYTEILCETEVNVFLLTTHRYFHVLFNRFV